MRNEAAAVLSAGTAIYVLLSVAGAVVSFVLPVAPPTSPFAHQSQPSFRTCASRASSAPGGSTGPVLSFPGGGIYFWWQAGAVMALNEHYDLQNSTVTMVGASAGALAATLAATGADLERGLDLALDLSERAGVFERGGLGLVWGGLVREWLQELLPDDAHLLCRDRVHLLALRIFPLRRERIHDFSSKDDLIDACMASVHIPYFMNARFSARFRGSRYLDGSFRASRNALSFGDDRPTLYFDWKDDPHWGTKGRDFLKLVNREGLLQMMNRGREHVLAMKDRGELECLEGVRFAHRDDRQIDFAVD